MSGSDLVNPYQDHITRTYRNLRKAMLNITIAFPLVLWFFGEWWYGIRPQRSLSEYYIAAPEMGAKGGWLRALIGDANNAIGNQLFRFLEEMNAEAPMRTWFVGMLFALGISLVLYEGLTPRENRLLDLAGILAIGVALFPVGCATCQPLLLGPLRLTAHGLSAYAAFICLGCVAMLAAIKAYLEEPVGVGRYSGTYLLAAVLMVVLPGMAYFFRVDRATFWMEAFGLWAFALYWIVKSIDMEGKPEHRLIRWLTWVLRPLAPIFGWIARKLRPVGDALEPIFRWLTDMPWVKQEVAVAHAEQRAAPEGPQSQVPEPEGEAKQEGAVAEGKD